MRFNQGNKIMNDMTAADEMELTAIPEVINPNF